MEEIKKEYSLLFNGITDTISQLQNTIDRLKTLQTAAEEAYITAAEPQEK